MATIESYMLETPERMQEIIEKSPKLFAQVKQAPIKRIIITGSGTSHHSGHSNEQLNEKITKD